MSSDEKCCGHVPHDSDCPRVHLSSEERLGLALADNAELRRQLATLEADPS